MNKTDIQELCRAQAFDHPTGDFTVRETHISWVILCGDFAYKIKKPVNFGFLDFSTLQQREHFCREELRLNRRFSPELYLDVIPVTGGDDGLMMGGHGNPIDYAVKMRRFDESQLLDNIAASGDLDASLIREIARELARLHGELPRCHPEPSGNGPGTPASFATALKQNFDQVRHYPMHEDERRRLESVEQLTSARYKLLLPTMQQRLRDGFVIDGHGDDHLGNMAIINGAVRLFDCIEFNEEFRIIDSVAEIALLDMDLNARGHPAESYRLLSDYMEYRGDFAGLALLDLYRSYYAMVRAKVKLLQYSSDHPALLGTEAYREFRQYLDLAYRYCQLRRLFVAITHGVSGSGKSTAAGKLVEKSGAVRIRSDVERKRLFGLAPEQRSRPEDERTLYSREMSARTFRRLAELAETILEAGFPVIVDGTFLHRRVREEFRHLADRHGVNFVILDCVADPEDIRSRLAGRQRDASEADVTVMEQQLAQIEPLSDADAGRVTVDSGWNPQRIWRAVEPELD